MKTHVGLLIVGLLSGVTVLSGCASPAPATWRPAAFPSPGGSDPGTVPSIPPSVAAGSPAPSATPAAGTAAPVVGNPDGHAAVPVEARAVDTSRPTRVVGDGTPASCTSEAVVAAVAAGGVITFSCGPGPVTITMKTTAKIRNANGPRIVLDGGGTVTLSGGGQRRILYMDTCDRAQGWTTSHCQDQDTPQLTVQNLTFADGNSTGDRTEGGGGGAIFVRGGRFKVVNSRFIRNRCDPTGPDLGGAAIRVLDQSRGLPVYVVNSTFGGAPGQGGSCANGGALSSIGQSWVVLNSVLSDNSSTDTGGGGGGAIYTDGNRYTVRIAGSIIENNRASEGGGAVFFVSNDRTGTLSIDGSVLRHNPSATFETKGYPGVFFLGVGAPTVTASRLS